MAVAAPQFLTADNISQVAVLASITAVAAIGQALVVITRNIDLSVEAIMGLVAYCVADHPREPPAERAGGDAWSASCIGLGLGMVNGLLVTVFKVPSIVATLGTLSIFRGIDYLIAGSHQVPLAGLPEGFTDPARDSILGLPIFVVVVIVATVLISAVMRWTRFGRQVYAVGSNPEAAAILGIPARGGRVRGVRPVRAARGRRRRDVGDRVRDDQRDVGERRRRSRSSPRSSSAA